MFLLQFAEKAAGEIWIMLNASADPIYSPDTYIFFHFISYSNIIFSDTKRWNHCDLLFASQDKIPTS